jgi:hypothetical protein
MKRFTIVKLFLSLGILFLSAAFSGHDAARGQQNLNVIAAPLCAPPCVKERVLLSDGTHKTICVCPPLIP